MKFQGELKWKAFKGFEACWRRCAIPNFAGHNVREASNQANAYRAMGTTTIRDNNPLLYKDPDDIYAVPVSILPAGGIYTRTDNRLLSYDFRFSATYNTTRSIPISSMPIWVWRPTRAIVRKRGSAAGVCSTIRVKFRSTTISSSRRARRITRPIAMGNTHYRNVAFFFNGTYSYKGRYTLNGTLRCRQQRAGPDDPFALAAYVERFGRMERPRGKFLQFDQQGRFAPVAQGLLFADGRPPSVTNALAVIQSYSPWRPRPALPSRV